jgi:hypothetical protein
VPIVSVINSSACFFSAEKKKMELFKSEDLAEAVNSLSTKFSEKVRQFFVLCIASDFC